MNRPFTLRALPAAATFALALALRLGYVLAFDEPILKHQYNYFNGGLAIVEHAHPWSFVLRSDDWHLWNDTWTLAPLYTLFLAGQFVLFGSHVFPVQVVQCVLDALTAVMVGLLGQRVAGPRGAWAGVAYAIYWPAILLPGRLLTENLHTVLLVGAFVLLLAGTRRPSESAPDAVASERTLLAGAFLLGVSALARAVSVAFLPLVVFWRYRLGGKARLRASALVLAAGCAAVVPWTARNVLVMREPVLIETVGVFNLFYYNTLVDERRLERREHYIAQQPSNADKRQLALRYALEGITKRPGAFAEKVWENFRHFFRPEGLQAALLLELPRPGWWLAASILLDDVILVGMLFLFLVYLLAGAPSPARALLGFWTAYYLFMVIVVFHNEIRYRSVLVPFALAGAAGGVAVLVDPARRRAWRALLGLTLGLALTGMMLVPYVVPAARALRSSWTLRDARAAVTRGDWRQAEELARRAADEDPGSARPWLLYGRWLAHASRPAEAAAAYAQAAERRPQRVARAGGHWVPLLVRPQLLREAGFSDEANRAAADVQDVLTRSDPWLVQETAWRELPAPRTDEVLLGRGDYGAVRGFLHARGNHRWSSGKAWIRLQPTLSASAYDVTLEMGSPPPAPYGEPEVTVSFSGGPQFRVRLTREVRPYTFRIQASGRTVLVSLRAPTWNLAGQPPEQGVRVDRLTIHGA